MMNISAHDAAILRELGKQKADWASRPIMQERIRLWKLHNALKPERPMMAIFPEGSWAELLPRETLQCEESFTRSVELDLRMEIYTQEHFDCDNVVDKDFFIMRAIEDSGWGLEAKHQDSSDARGAWAFDPVIQKPSDLKKIKMPVITHDEAASQARLEAFQEVFDGVLPVKLMGISHISFHFMALYSGWRGLEEVMMDMIDEPEMLHEAMSIVQAGYEGVLKQWEEQNLLDTNHDRMVWLSSGSIGYTDELPAEGFDPDRVRLKDMWGSSEVQELTQVSPTMHEEFAMRYERPLLERFGLTGYGCCEDVTQKLDLVLDLPNIRKVSISPWGHVKICAERMERKYIMNWKPNPSMLVGGFHEAHIRSYLRQSLEDARGAVLEMVLKDTHTCEQRPERFEQWSRIAREEINRFMGA